jgi:hypothetical protein
VRVWYVPHVLRLHLATLAVALSVSMPAGAEVRRLHWRGVFSDGTPPAHLERTTEVHLAVTLKQMGIDLAPGMPFDGEAAARCQFAPPQRVGRCTVEVVQTSDGLRAERKVELPFRDADDLAESLSLLVSDMLQTDLHELVAPPPPAPPSDGQPGSPNGDGGSGAGRPKGPGENGADKSDGKTGSDERAARLAKAARLARAAQLRRASEPPVPSQMSVDIGASMAVGFTGEPVLAGGQLRVMWARGLLRAGGALSMTGTSTARGGYDLSFFRLLTGPRAGIGATHGRLDFDLTVGPALSLLATDAHVPDGTHALATLAFVAGARLSLILTPRVALQLGLDVAVAVARESVRAGTHTLVDFDLGTAEISLGLAYRP